MDDVSMETMLDLSHIKRETKEHLTRVYGALTATAGAAALGTQTYSLFLANVFSGFWLLLLGSIFCMWKLKSTPCNNQVQPISRWMYLLGFGYLSGVSSGPLVELVDFIDPSIVPTAFVMTTLIFATFTMVAFQSSSRTWVFLGGILGSLVLGSLTMSLANLFIGSIFLYKVELLLGLLIFSGFVVFDTQVIITKHAYGDHDYLSHALDLFIDFAALFRRIVVLLAQNKGRPSSERKTKRR
eukprot:gene3930-6402_t